MSRVMYCAGCNQRVGMMADKSTIRPWTVHLCASCDNLRRKMAAGQKVEIIKLTLPVTPDA